MRATPKLALAMVLCCAVPMALIVVMTSVIGVTFGWASAMVIAVAAAGVCVAVMVQHHRDAHSADAPRERESPRQAH